MAVRGSVLMAMAVALFGLHLRPFPSRSVTAAKDEKVVGRSNQANWLNQSENSTA
jgi:hypothetical protein